MYPWTGGRSVRAKGRSFEISGPLPQEPCWVELTVDGGKRAKISVLLTIDRPASCGDELFEKVSAGYLAGEFFIRDQIRSRFDPADGYSQVGRVFFVEPGLERFARCTVGRWEDGRLIYLGQGFPLGPEAEVTAAWQDKKASVRGIEGVTPSLEFTFLFETWRRDEEEKAKVLVQERERERARLENEVAARQAEEGRRKEIAQRLGTGQGRRDMVKVDFGEAAKAALAVGGAELLDSRQGRSANEMVVQFRLEGGRYECVCHRETLRIIDSGICLVDHRTEEKGDTRFTLESLPGVILQAKRERKLVVFRQVDPNGYVQRGDEGNWEDDDA